MMTDFETKTQAFINELREHKEELGKRLEQAALAYEGLNEDIHTLEAALEIYRRRKEVVKPAA